MTQLDAIVDPGVLHDLFELAGSDLKFVEALVETFTDRAEMLCETLREALDAQDCESIERVAHEIRSSSSQLGALRLPALSKQLEARAAAGERDLGDLYEIFLSEVRLACEALEERARMISTPQTAGEA